MRSRPWDNSTLGEQVRTYFPEAFLDRLGGSSAKGCCRQRLLKHRASYVVYAKRSLVISHSGYSRRRFVLWEYLAVVEQPPPRNRGPCQTRTAMLRTAQHNCSYHCVFGCLPPLGTCLSSRREGHCRAA